MFTVDFMVTMVTIEWARLTERTIKIY